MYKVLIPQEVSVKGIEYLEANGCECILLEDCSVENICKNVADCDAILARNTMFPKEVADAGKKLKIVARHGVGFDNIDVKAFTDKGIKVTLTPGANSNSVAEHTIALILACAKNIPFFDENTRLGNWSLGDTVRTIDVLDKTLGIVGCGSIGRLVAQKAALGLGMKVIAYDAFPIKDKPDYITVCDNMDEIFEKSDFVSLHLPLTPDTRKIVNKDKFEMMKSSAYFINAARGGSVDEDDLYEALLNKTIAGAALDVYELDPPEKDNKLFTLDNIIVTPHNAAHSVDSMDRMAFNAAREIVRVLNGEEPLWEIK